MQIGSYQVFPVLTSDPLPALASAAFIAYSRVGLLCKALRGVSIVKGVVVGHLNPVHTHSNNPESCV